MYEQVSRISSGCVETLTHDLLSALLAILFPVLCVAE
jgi:hypothetical protein